MTTVIRIAGVLCVALVVLVVLVVASAVAWGASASRERDIEGGA